MKAIVLLVISIVLGAASCDKQTDVNTEIWWINSSKTDCVGVAPMSCLQIQKGDEIESDNWELFYSDIKGFDFEPGNIYRIKVKIMEKDDPIPADASSKEYELVEILSKEIDPALRITNIWKVIKVGEIENPTDFKNDEPLIFELDASKKTYVGNMGCNSVRGEIKEIDSEQLIFLPGAATMMACPAMETEKSISQALIDTRGYKLENNQLYLLNDTGEIIMTFQAVD